MEQDDELADQRRHPEWKVVMQERRAGFVETQRLIAQWNVDGFGGGKGIGAVENTGARVDLRRSIEQEILKRGMQIPAYHQACLGCEQNHIGRSLLTGDVYRTPGHYHLSNKL